MADTFSLRDPVIELAYREGLPTPVPLDVGSDLRRELGGKVGRLVARQPLFERLKGRTDGLLRLIVVVKLR